MPTPSLTHAHEPKPTQAQRAGFGYMVGHVRLETVEITSPVPKTQPFCPWGGHTSDPEHHIHTIQPISITRALHALKWNRHDRQICVITATDQNFTCTECDHQKGIKYSTHTLVGLVLHFAIHLNLEETTTTECVNRACKSTDMWNQSLPF